MTRLPLSVTFIALNEAEKIGRAIQSVNWAEDVVVVDSGSTDDTCQIAQNLGARVIQNPWKGYGQQKNFAQGMARFDWVLNLDADEEVSPELRSEIERALEEQKTNPERPDKPKGYLIPRKTFYLGRWIQYGGWYPNYLIRLADRRVSKWTEPHVHEALQVKGRVATLSSPILHDAFSSIQDQVHTNLRFSKLGAQDLISQGKTPSLGKLIFKPLGKFFETYFLKKGYRDGLPGFIIAANAAHSMFLKYAHLFENEIRVPKRIS